jgi:hypothetical protein
MPNVKIPISNEILNLNFKRERQETPMWNPALAGQLH